MLIGSVFILVFVIPVFEAKIRTKRQFVFPAERAFGLQARNFMGPSTTGFVPFGSPLFDQPVVTSALYPGNPLQPMLFGNGAMFPVPLPRYAPAIVSSENVSRPFASSTSVPFTTLSSSVVPNTEIVNSHINQNLTTRLRPIDFEQEVFRRSFLDAMRPFLLDSPYSLDRRVSAPEADEVSTNLTKILADSKL